MRVSPGIASPSLRLAAAARCGTKLCRRPRRPVARVYGCETIGYLLLCIWHIVKLIERDDKIAMFFDVKRGERLAGERDRERDSGGREGELREGGGLTWRQTGRKRESEGRRREEGDSERRIAYAQGEKRRARSGAASRPGRSVCDEPEGPVRDHPNSQDLLFSGARSMYAEVAESGGAEGGAEQTVVGQERVCRRGRAPTPLEILNCR